MWGEQKMYLSFAKKPPKNKKTANRNHDKLQAAHSNF